MSWHWLSSEENSRVTLADEVARKLRLYVMEHRSLSSGSDLEVGGFLLGWIEQYYPLRVRIEDLEPIVCGHCGKYRLVDEGRKVLEKALQQPRAVGLKVIGFFRSYCGREPVLDAFDQELFTTYFPNRTHVLLVLHPTSPVDCCATVRFGDESSSKPHHSLFWFYEGLSQTDLSETEEITVVPESLSVPRPVQDSRQNVVPESLPVPAPYQESAQNIEALPAPESEPLSNFGSPMISRNWLPWLAAAASVLILVPVYIRFTGGRQVPSVVSAPKGVASRTSEPPVTAATPQSSQPEPAAVGPTPDATVPSSPTRPVVAVAPEIRHAVQPKIPSGIRARITDRVVIPVRVRVSSAGKVVGAVLENGEEKDGMHRYLRRAAARAALAWSFDPAKTKEGTPIMAEREISFVFEPQ